MRIENRHGQSLSAELVRPDGATRLVILCHGFTTSKHTGSVRTVAAHLHEKGVATLRYDAMGHGDSYGSLSELLMTRLAEDFVDVIEHAKRLGWVESIGAFGSSMGGGTVILGAARSDDLSCVAAKAPVSDWKKNWLRNVGMSAKEWKTRDTVPWTHRGRGYESIHYAMYADLDAIDMYTEATRISCPVLILQGDQDTSVPSEDTRLLADVIDDCSLRVLEGEDHAFSKTFDGSMRFFADWLEKNL